MNIIPLQLGLQIQQGADFSVIIDVANTDLTGYEFKGQLRPSTNPFDRSVTEFEFAIQNQYTNLGQVEMSLSSETIDQLMLSIAYPNPKARLETRFLYDVKMKDTNGNVSRILEGPALISPQATQENF